MMKRTRTLLFLLVALALLGAPLGSAQEDNPTIAVLRLASNPGISLGEKGLLDMLQAYELINAEERTQLNGANNLYGEHLTILYRDAGGDIPTANLMIEDAIDRGADVMVTYTTTIAQIAADITRDLDDPPLIIFAIVGTPYFAGIAEAPCVKAGHIAGTQVMAPYAQAMDLLPAIVPDAAVIGTVVNTSAANEVFGAQLIAKLAAAKGIATETAAVVTLADLPLAVESVIDSGAQAIFMPSGFTSAAGMPVISSVAADQGVPVMTVVPTTIFRGATLSGGFYSIYQEGVTAGRMLIAHLNGDIDLGKTGINSKPGFHVALNLDAAAATGIEISDELLALADWTIENGLSPQGVTADLPEIGASLPEMPLDERRAADLEFLAELECTDEMIAEQQAALDAAG